MSDFCLSFPALPACVATKEQVWSERVVVFLCLCVCECVCEVFAVTLTLRP